MATNDQLADVIAKHVHGAPHVVDAIAAAVRAHLAAVLDAEEAKCLPNVPTSRAVFANIRDALGVAAPTARDET